jgi:hypothetical protein
MVLTLFFKISEQVFNVPGTLEYKKKNHYLQIFTNQFECLPLKNKIPKKGTRCSYQK